MAQVTIKATQSHLFTEGSIVRVERTPFIDSLIEKEQVIVVDDSELAADVDMSPSINPELVVPQRNAQTEDWAAFVGTHVPGVQLRGDELRGELIDIWDTYSTGAPDPSTGTSPVLPEQQLPTDPDATPNAEDTGATSDGTGDGTATP